MPESPPPPPRGSSPDPWPRPGDDASDDPPPPPPPPEALLGPGVGTGDGRHTTGWLLAGLLVVLLVASVVVGVRNGLRPAVDEQAIGEVAPGAEVPDPLVPSEVEQRREAAGCVVTVDTPLEDRTHLDPSTAPPPETLYPDRPAHSGQHFGRLLALPDGTGEEPLDERAVLHNMEHGSVVVWFRPDTGARGDVADWRASRTRLGFTSSSGGAVFASPMPDLDDPPAVALRAWGVAMDCERFDPVVADAFLVDHWGSHGDAPEANLSPYPSGSLAWSEAA